jgi:hypothetical protein
MPLPSPKPVADLEMRRVERGQKGCLHPTRIRTQPEATLPPNLKASAPESRFLEIAADSKDAAPFEAAFGKGGAAG